MPIPPGVTRKTWKRMVKAVTPTAPAIDNSVPSASAATSSTAASSIQLGSVQDAARNRRAGDTSLNCARNVCNADRNGGHPALGTGTPERSSRRSAPAVTAISAGRASPCSHCPLPSGNASRTPAATAIAMSEAKSSRRATVVEVAASAMGTPRRTARTGRAASPMPKGSTWLASNVVCSMANSETVPGRCVRSARHAHARSQNAPL